LPQKHSQLLYWSN